MEIGGYFNQDGSLDKDMGKYFKKKTEEREMQEEKQTEAGTGLDMAHDKEGHDKDNFQALGSLK